MLEWRASISFGTALPITSRSSPLRQVCTIACVTWVFEWVVPSVAAYVRSTSVVPGLLAQWPVAGLLRRLLPEALGVNMRNMRHSRDDLTETAQKLFSGQDRLVASL